MKKTNISFFFILFLAISLAPFHLEANEQSAKKEIIAKAGQAKDVSSVTALISILETDPDGYTRAFTAWALGEIGDKRAVTALNNALNDVDKGVKIEAEKALSKIK